MPAGGIAAHFRPSVAQPASGKAARSRSAVMLTAAGAEVFKVLSGRAHAEREIDDFERRCLVGDERVQRQCGLCKKQTSGFGRSVFGLSPLVVPASQPCRGSSC
jgi:hypothetical protein